MESIPLIDLAVIESQLGRRPRGVIGVPVRCSYGYPQVIRVRPLIDDEPFPTLFWLTCPFLSKRIDRLEANGWIRRLEDRLAADEPLRSATKRAHERYIAERAALLSSADRERLETRGRTAALLERGIGGLADLRRLKCLHLHVAHALAEENPVGAIVLDMLSERQCAAGSAICDGFVGEVVHSPRG